MKIEIDKRLIRPFLIVFITLLLVFNWSYISWLFNYQFVSDILFSFIDSFKVREKRLSASVKESFDKERGEYTERVNGIEIPLIEVSVPLIIGESAEKDVLERNLKNGAVYYPSSALPGENGQTVILGHSAPLNWPKVKYNWVFRRLADLKEGDEVFVYFQNRKYHYIVREKMFLEKGEDIPQPLTNSNNMLLLISCWPPGKDLKRIAVRAELVN